MTGSISARAQAILDEIERDSAGPAASPEPTPSLPMEPPSAPQTSHPPLPDGDATPELGPLVESVLEQVEQARARLRALSEAIEDVAGRVGVPVEQVRPDEPTPSFPAPEIAPLVPLEEQLGALEDLLARRSEANLQADVPSRPASAPPPAPVTLAPAPRAAPSAGGLASVPAGRPTRPAASPSRPRTDNARLVASEFAAAGVPRAEVGQRLRDEYGMEDPEEVLDFIFGTGSAGDTRLPRRR